MYSFILIVKTNNKTRQLSLNEIRDDLLISVSVTIVKDQMCIKD